MVRGTENPQLVAVVPMRGGSERVPGKNLRALGGVPLYHHIVRTLLAVAEVDRIVIDTDSPHILQDAKRNFPTAVLVRRPDHLGAGHVSMNEVLANTLVNVDAELVLQVHATSPFLTSSTLSSAVQQLDDDREHDSAFGVTRFHARFWDHLGRPMNHDPAVLQRTQDLPPIFLENSAFYIFTRQLLLERGNRIGTTPLMVELDSQEALDIDIEADFELAENLMASRSPRMRP